jgi:ubiquinone/menaquinone biosynthesis C-methylase UbiE
VLRASGSAEQEPGPDGAFAPGREADARRSLFNRIAPVYDELNNNLSFGQHWVWKQMTVKWSGAKAGGRALDVCCGSGDLAFLLARAVGPKGEVRLSQCSCATLQAPEMRQLHTCVH